MARWKQCSNVERAPGILEEAWRRYWGAGGICRRAWEALREIWGSDGRETKGEQADWTKWHEDMEESQGRGEVVVQGRLRIWRGGLRAMGSDKSGRDAEGEQGQLHWQK